MAGGEGGAVDEAALLLCPGLAVRVGHTGVPGGGRIRAGWGEFPAIAELQGVAHHGLAPRGEVIEGLVIKVPAEPADPALVFLAQTDKHAGPAVPGQHQSLARLHHQVDAHEPNLVGQILAWSPLHHFVGPVV